MNKRLDSISPYPFEQLARLLKDISPADVDALDMTVGQPDTTPPPQLQSLPEHLDEFRRYPPMRGQPALRKAIAAWAHNRFAAPLDPNNQILPVSGTREALFSIAQTVVDPTIGRPLVLVPNPMYKIYEGAALLAGARIHTLDCLPDNGFIPDFSDVPESVWRDCQLLYLCSPNNPTGAVLDEATLIEVLEHAERYNFVIASDECYSEIYPDEDAPPQGMLGACVTSGRDHYQRVLVFNSLSKRSGLAGMRSGFAAGDAEIIARYQRYRSYHGISTPVPLQRIATELWQDEVHVIANRDHYRARFAAVEPLLGYPQPGGGFYLWLTVPGDDQAFARLALAQENIRILPGSLLGTDTGAGNPGAGFVRLSLVHPPEHCAEAAERLQRVIASTHP